MMADTATDELVRRVTAAESRLTVLDSRDQPELITESFLRLPQLRGYWPLASHRASGGANDESGTGLNLTYNGNPLYTTSNWLTYLALDGVGDSLSRADETAIDIRGNEAYVAVANRGLTIGGWFWSSAYTATCGFIGKWGAAAARSYGLAQGTVVNQQATFDVSVDGTAIAQVASTAGTLTLDTWWFLVGRFTPSTELKLWMNEDTYTNVAAIPASIYNSATTFYIGNRNGSLLTGRAALCFLCAGILSDNVIEDLFERTRWLFGV